MEPTIDELYETLKPIVTQGRVISYEVFIADAIRYAENALRPMPLLNLTGFDSALLDAVDAFYDSFETPTGTPHAVIRAIVLKFLGDLPTATGILSNLGYDSLNGNWYFTYAKQYHGVEVDGYIHT